MILHLSHNRGKAQGLQGAAFSLRLGTRAFGIAARALQKGRKFLWRFTGRPAGAHAVPLTASGKVVLVKLTYAKGWRLPGGGRKSSERAQDAILRELREEIGMTGYSAIEQIHEVGVDPVIGALFLVTGVEYRPVRSLEIEAVAEFDPASLPEDASDRSRRWVAHVLGGGGATAGKS